MLYVWHEWQNLDFRKPCVLLTPCTSSPVWGAKRGYSLDQVQMLTDHARRDSVKRYAAVQLDAKRRLLEGKQGR
jgi:hypothetical protein